MGEEQSEKQVPDEAAQQSPELPQSFASLSDDEQLNVLGPSEEQQQRRSHRRETEPLNDTTNAAVFVAMNEENVRYVPGVRWHIWDGQRYAPDETGQIRELAKKTALAMLRESADEPDELRRKKLAGWAIRSGNRDKINGMLEMAESVENIVAVADSLDADPMKFNALNGTVDQRTGELRAHDRADLLTKLAGAPFKPDCPTPRWTRFLREIFADDDELIRFVQRALGYSMTADGSEQALFICYGTGANGKSSLFEIIRYVLGDYARTADFGTLAARRHESEIRDDIVALMGARFVTAVEVGAGKAFNEKVVKQLTGGDRIRARTLYERGIEFTPGFHFWIAANVKPEVRGTDNAIWRRLHLIRFNVTIPDERRDPNLGAKLKSEAPGILAWLVRGCLDWQAMGLAPPQIVKAATAEYREEMDAVAGFLSACTVPDPRAKVPFAELNAAYVRWAAVCGEEALKQKAFGSALAGHGFANAKVSGKAVRRGLRLVERENPQDDQDDNDEISDNSPSNGSQGDFLEKPSFSSGSSSPRLANPEKGPVVPSPSDGAEPVAEFADDDDDDGPNW